MGIIWGSSGRKRVQCKNKGFEKMRINPKKIINFDNLTILKEWPLDCFTACVTDPPYGLKFMHKKWDCQVPKVELWAEVLRVLKPGGWLLCFSGTRTQHRMACNIEDAGFEIRDMLAWVYGSGFPKSLDVSKAIDKAAGAEQDVVGSRRKLESYGKGNAVFGSGPDHGGEQAITAPATDAARQWEGWGTALKPALEPITLARKPFSGTVADNALKNGAGGLNVDGCRVGYADGEISGTAKRREYGFTPNIEKAGDSEFRGALRDRTDPIKKSMPKDSDNKGRWPANLIHDGSEEVLEVFPGEGEKSAARFFYCAKASKAERNKGLDGACSHPTVKPLALMRYLVRLVKQPGANVILDPYAGTGTTGLACELEGVSDYILFEQSAEYVKIMQKREA